MQHVLYGQKSIFLGDDAARALIEYAAHVAQVGGGDSLQMVGINAEGNVVTTLFLLNSGTDLTAESTSMPFPEPDNSESIAYVRGRLRGFSVDGVTDDDPDGEHRR